MKRLLYIALLFLSSPCGAQTAGSLFFDQHISDLKRRFGGLATDAELVYLLEKVLDHKHLEVDYNHYFRPAPAPLAYLFMDMRRASGSSISVAHIKNDLIYPLLRYVLPKSLSPATRMEVGGIGERITRQVYHYLGIPYGSPSYNRETGQGSLDCSGLVNYVLEDLRIQYRRGDGQSAVLGLVNSPDFKTVMGEPQPGDLLVRKHKNNVWSHVGIYVGKEQLIEAPYSGTVVRVTPYKAEKWQKIIRHI